MSRILKLGQFLPIARLGNEALEEANKVLERWDVPHEVNGVPVPKDIDNRDPHWWRTRDGHRLAGLITPTEIAFGAPSPATPVLIGMFPVIAMVTTILTLIFGWPIAVLGFAAMGFIAYVLAVSEGVATAATMFFLGGVLPFLGASSGSISAMLMSHVSEAQNSSVDLSLTAMTTPVS